MGVVVGVGLLAFGLPGAFVAWLGVTSAAWMATPVQLTGKKDSSGFPTAAHPGEARAMQRYRFWADLKWRLIFPTSAFLPGWGVYASWVFGIWGAVVTWCLPHLGVPDAPAVEAASRAVDALAVFVLVTQVSAARRRTLVAGDVSPGVRVSRKALSELASKRRDLALALGAGVVGSALGAVGATLLLPPPPLPAAGLVWPFLGAIGGFAAGASHWWIDVCLAEWRELNMAREEWKPRWEALKHDPAPRLLKRTKVGNATVDRFSAAPSMGAIAYWSLGPKMSPTLGAGQRIAVRSVPNVDSQGQDQPGTRHPLDFEVVAWPADALPDITNVETDPEEVSLFFQCAMIWACDESGYARPIIDQAHPIALTAPAGHDGPAPGAAADEAPEPSAPESDTSTSPQTSPVQAWASTWMLPDGPPWDHIRKGLAGSVADLLGCEVLVDHRAGVLYAGRLTSGETVFDPETGVEAVALERLAIEDQWNARWADVLKQDVNPPTVEHPTYAEATLANGRTVVHRQAFITRQGVDPNDFFGLEPKIAATITGAPFVAVTGWPSRGRSGERHAQAFTVYWANEAVPSNPDALAPPADRRGPGRRPTGGGNEAQQWVLAGRFNEAFKAARLAKPELYDARCLTTARSRGHIWRVALRLYGGVTLADVRGAAERLRQALGSEWLRVEAAPDGCVIVAGAHPSRVDLTDAKKDGHYIASLDWEQAFLDAKVVGVGGITPTLIAVDRLPNNQQVQVLDFTLPSGLAFVDVKAKTKQMETASKNAFVEVRRHPSGKADEFRMLASEINPMPERADFDWEAADTGDHRIPFATNLFGEPTCYDNRADPHLLISGQSGAGKSVTLQAIIYGAVVRGWDLWVVDPSKGAVDFNFAEPYARAVGRTVWEAKGIIAAIYDEVLRRKAINSAHNCGNYRDLPDDVRYNHVLIVLDEFTSMMMPEPVPKAMDDSTETLQAIESVKAINAARAFIGTYVGKIVREARSTGFTMLLATQALKADTLSKIPGANDLKDNMSRMIVGRASFGQLMAALKNATEAPEQPDVLPPGRGLYEGNGRTAEVIQCWFEGSQATFAEHLRAYVQPLPVERRLDLSTFVEPELEVDGALIDNGAPPPPTPTHPFQTEQQIVEDLGTVELSLDDLELTLEDLADADDEQDSVDLGDPAADPFAGGPSPSDEQIAEWASTPKQHAESQTFDWDAAEAAAQSEPNIEETGAELDWTAATAVEPADDGVVVESHIVWDEIDPGPWMPEASAYEWDEIDALITFVDEFSGIETVEWTDPQLDQEDGMGVAFRDVVVDLLAERGIVLLGGTTAQPSEPPPAALPTAPEHLPEPEAFSVPSDPASSASSDDDDEFGPLPKVPAHLIPDSDEF